MVAVLGWQFVICPHCGEQTAHRSHRSGIKDRLMRLFEMIPYRCRKCSKRFYAYRAGEKSSKLRTHEERKIMELRRRLAWRRSKRELFAYVAAALLLLAIIYSAMQQRLG
jgi:hypothetical protein